MQLINFLPWREQLRQAQKRKFTLILGVSIFSIILIQYAIKSWVKSSINNTQQEVNTLQANIIQLNPKLSELQQVQLRKNQLTDFIALIATMKNEQLKIRKVINTFSEIIPSGVFLNQLDYQSKKIILKGQAETQGQIALLMHNIVAMKCLGQPKLQEIKTINNAGLISSNFLLEIIN